MAVSGSLLGGGLTTRLSDPTQGDRWFSGRTSNQAYPNPTRFLGDYSGIDASQGVTAASWTDMRGTADFGGRSGAAEDAWFTGSP